MIQLSTGMYEAWNEASSMLQITTLVSRGRVKYFIIPSRVDAKLNILQTHVTPLSLMVSVLCSSSQAKQGTVEN